MVLLQGTTAVVEIADDDGLMSRFAEWGEFLLYGIPRETVADT